MFSLDATPGLIFVLASFLPLLAGLLILLVAILRALLAPVTEKNPTAETVYKLLGGDQPAHGAGVTAGLACGLALLFALLGLGIYFDRAGTFTEKRQAINDQIATYSTRLATAPPASRGAWRRELDSARQTRDRLDREFQSQWNGEAAWLRVAPAGSTPEATVPLGFHIDGLAALLFLLVALLALFIHMYSMSYLTDEAQEVEDPQVPQEFGGLRRRGRLSRYYIYLCLFTFAMFQVVLANNLVQFFLAGQLLGLSAYLLIGFWYERPATNTIALRTFLLHRVGDGIFLIGIVMLWTGVGSVRFADLEARLRAPLEDQHGLVTPGGQFVTANPGEVPDRLHIVEGFTGERVMLLPTGTPETIRIPRVGDELEVIPRDSLSTWYLALAGLCLVGGCLPRLAQVPLQTWLPEGLVGPLPALALIQTATLTAAGVYLLGRVYPILTPGVLLVLAYVGLIGLVLGAVTALYQVDFNRVLVFSTISQVGLILIGLGVGAWSGALFHLMTHAVIKGVLLLGAGCILYATQNTADLRKLGGLAMKMPLTATAMLLAVLALSGMPFLSGWYSKEAIVEQTFAFVWLHPRHFLLFVGPVLVSGVTAFYLFRLWILIFQGLPREPRPFLQADEAPSAMLFPLLVLGFLTVTLSWGLTLWDANGSWIESRILESQPLAVQSDHGTVPERGEVWAGGAIKPPHASERRIAYHYGWWAMVLAFLVAAGGVYLASQWYAPKELITEDAFLQALGLPPEQAPLPRTPGMAGSNPLPGPRLWIEDDLPPTDTVPDLPVVAPSAAPPPPPAPVMGEPGRWAVFLTGGCGLATLYDVLFAQPICWLSARLAWVDTTVLQGAGTFLARGSMLLARGLAVGERQIVGPTFAWLGGRVEQVGGLVRRWMPVLAVGMGIGLLVAVLMQIRWVLVG